MAASGIGTETGFETRGPAKASTGGRRVYAVGDVHGRLDLLDRLLSAVRADADDAGERPALVFLGDYVDRGPDSKGVVDRLIALEAAGEFEVRALLGNHEAAMLDFLDDPLTGPQWTAHGALETLRSYGVKLPRARRGAEPWEDISSAFAANFPAAHRDFALGLRTMVRIGDYAFVHAGVRPGAPLERQSPHDLIWIREEFLASDGPYPAFIVHGHTPRPEPIVGRWRIGIDTGAFATGALTALRIEDADRRFIQVRAGARAPSVWPAPQRTARTVSAATVIQNAPQTAVMKAAD